MSKYGAVSMDGSVRLPRSPRTVHQQSRILRPERRQRVCYRRRLTRFKVTVAVGGNDLDR